MYEIVELIVGVGIGFGMALAAFYAGRWSW